MHMKLRTLTRATSWGMPIRYSHWKKPRNLRGWSSLSNPGDLEPHLNKVGIGTKNITASQLIRGFAAQPDMRVTGLLYMIHYHSSMACFARLSLH